VAHRSHDTEEAKVKDVLKDLQDKNINVRQLVEFQAKLARLQNRQPKKEVPHKDIGLGNAKQLSAILNVLRN
jgi:hypothetical protein